MTGACGWCASRGRRARRPRRRALPEPQHVRVEIDVRVAEVAGRGAHVPARLIEARDTGVAMPDMEADRPRLPLVARDPLGLVQERPREAASLHLRGDGEMAQ